MKYFTPQLYSQGNSPDEAEADWVDEEWDRQIKKYKRHYRKIKDQLPESLRRFHDEQCLHDAYVLTPALLPRSAPWNGQYVVLVAQQTNTLIPEYLNTLAILQYTVTAPPTVEIPLEGPGFSKHSPHWLYEEIDVVSPGIFSMEILISDGRVIKLQFSDFTYHIAPLCLPGQPAVGTAEPKITKTQMASA